MTRLTKAIREKMVGKAIQTAGINTEFLKLRTRRAALADAIRVDSLDGQDTIDGIIAEYDKIRASVSSDGFKKVQGYGFNDMYKDYELYNINLGGMRVTLQYNGQYDRAMIVGVDRAYRSPVPYDNNVNYPADHEFTKTFLSIEKERRALVSRRDGLRVQVSATLKQFTTIKKLLEQWPESKDLLPSDLNESKPQLPVVQVKDLNCLIGLPSEVDHDS